MFLIHSEAAPCWSLNVIDGMTSCRYVLAMWMALVDESRHDVPGEIKEDWKTPGPANQLKEDKQNVRLENPFKHSSATDFIHILGHM